MISVKDHTNKRKTYATTTNVVPLRRLVPTIRPCVISAPFAVAAIPCDVRFALTFAMAFCASLALALMGLLDLTLALCETALVAPLTASFIRAYHNMP